MPIPQDRVRGGREEGISLQNSCANSAGEHYFASNSQLTSGVEMSLCGDSVTK